MLSASKPSHQYTAPPIALQYPSAAIVAELHRSPVILAVRNLAEALREFETQVFCSKGHKEIPAVTSQRSRTIGTMCALVSTSAGDARHTTKLARGASEGN